MKPQIKVILTLMAASCSLAANTKAEPQPGEPKTVAMGSRGSVRIRTAFNQATLIKLPEGQRVMNVFGADKGEGGLWAVDAGKVPTRFVAVKPKATGIHTTLHVISNTGEEVSFFAEEVTGKDSQFDAEVDVMDGGPGGASTEAAEVKWVPADEVTACKKSSDAMRVDVAAVQKKAEEDAAAKLAAYQAEYPKKLFFGYEWDHKKAAQLGFEVAWSDGKFTYFKAKDVVALYEIDGDGKPSLIEYSYEDGVYVVKKVLYDGYFAIGKKKANRLVFHRDRSKT
jgi:type IV secretion system protein VirB9